jgi:succinate dehydrogenase / fumarate reductase membrane anchor subunit
VRESRFWALHLLSGAVLLGLLGIHMTIMHFDAILRVVGGAHEPVLTFASVVARDRHAVMRVLYVLLLGFALYHGLYGVRGILREVWDGSAAAWVINAGVLLVGALVFAYGVGIVVRAGRIAVLM